MDEQRIPRTWIGDEVGIFWRGRKDDEKFVLIDVVPEGLVLEVKRTVEREGKTYEGTAHTLATWHVIDAVQKYVGTEELDDRG